MSLVPTPNRSDDPGFSWIDRVGESDPELSPRIPMSLDQSVAPSLTLAISLRIMIIKMLRNRD
jgi:hypothetical protein